MELTPIKIRGKRRTKGEEVIVVPPPKRRKRDPNREKSARVRRPRASYLEKSMPLEVIERIFWMSENVNLPRASPRLGRLLSGPSTLRETFLAAFGPIWKAGLGRVNRPAQDSTTWDREGFNQSGGNPDFQTDILACSWTTIDMILDCRSIWAQRHVRTLSFEYRPLWDNSSSPSPDTGLAPGIHGIQDSGRYFYRDYDGFRNAEHHIFSADIRDYPLEQDMGTLIEVHRYVEIPDGLLTGPWDEGSLRKLFWLMRAGASLSFGQTWELTREGFSNAILNHDAPNLTAIRILHIMSAFENWPRHVREEELGKVEMIMRILKRDGTVDLLAKYTYVKWLLIKDG